MELHSPLKDQASKKQLMVQDFGPGIVKVTSVALCPFIPVGGLDNNMLPPYLYRDLQ